VPERFALVPAIYLFLLREGRVLLLRRRGTGFADGRYGPIAGHMDGGESVVAAAAREAREEAGVDVAPADLEVVGVMHCQGDDVHREYVLFFLVARRWAGEPSNREPEKCDDLAWFPLEALPENTIGFVRRALEDRPRGVWFESLGFEAAPG
jgi:8-oxo-dGTP pyrophosphatase MutT (NUDIX family)